MKTLLHKTMNGWPTGERIAPTGKWQVFISPRAYAKLMAWHQGSNGLELSGYAMLSEPPVADPAQDKLQIFYIEDILLVCAIDESTSGYTEMPAELRAKAMMEARSMGYKPNQLVWWHKHPITNWSPIDIDTMRQRIHELNRPEVLYALSFVLTPAGIRTRWDRSGPNEGDNAYVDPISTTVGDPSLIETMRKAQNEVAELMATKAPEVVWVERETMTESDILDMARTQAVVYLVGEKTYNASQLVCKEDPATIVDAWACGTCPFVHRCYELSFAEIEDAAYAILGEVL